MIQKRLITDIGEKEAISLLESLGYLIIKPDTNDITSNQELVDYFYTQMKALVGNDRACFLQVRNKRGKK